MTSKQIQPGATRLPVSRVVVANHFQPEQQHGAGVWLLAPCLVEQCLRLERRLLPRMAVTGPSVKAAVRLLFAQGRDVPTALPVCLAICLHRSRPPGASARASGSRFGLMTTRLHQNQVGHAPCLPSSPCGAARLLCRCLAMCRGGCCRVASVAAGIPGWYPTD